MKMTQRWLGMGLMLGAVALLPVMVTAKTDKSKQEKMKGDEQPQKVMNDAAKDPMPMWEVDPAHSTVAFEVRHLGLSKVRGHFSKYDAMMQADAITGRITALDATVHVDSITTGIEKRDNHLKSDDFFAADKFPVMKMHMKKITWKANTFKADVELTIRNVTKTVQFEGENTGTRKVNFGAPQLRTGYEAHATINRQDFGLKFNAVAEGTAIVSDDVKIMLDMEIFQNLIESDKKS